MKDNTAEGGKDESSEDREELQNSGEISSVKSGASDPDIILKELECHSGQGKEDDKSEGEIKNNVAGVVQLADSPQENIEDVFPKAKVNETQGIPVESNNCASEKGLLFGNKAGEKDSEQEESIPIQNDKDGEILENSVKEGYADQEKPMDTNVDKSIEIHSPVILETTDNEEVEIAGIPAHADSNEPCQITMEETEKQDEKMDGDACITDPNLLVKNKILQNDDQMEIDADDNEVEPDLVLIEKDPSETKDKQKEVISLSDDESEEGEGVGSIRIRDFGSIKEISEDEDDDVIEILRIPTRRVRIEDEPDAVPDMELECDEENNYNTLPIGNTIQKLADVKRKLLAFRQHIKDSGGIRVLEGADTLQNVSHVISNQGHLSTTTRGFLQSTRAGISVGGNTHTYRINANNRTPVSIVRGRNISTTQNGATKSKGTVINAGKLNLVSMNNIQPLTQLIFDPSSGLLLCPTPGGGNTMQAIRPSSQALQTIQNASQLATNRLNNPGSRMTSAQIVSTSSNVVGSTASIQNFTDTRNSAGNPHHLQAATKSYATIASAARPTMTATSSMRPTTTVRMPTALQSGIRPISSSNTPVRYKTARLVTTFKNKEPQPYVRASTAPTASATVKLLNQQKLAASAALTNSAVNKPEEVTAGTLQSASAPEKDPHNSKTFPSLVVLVKPCLQDKLSKVQQQGVRGDLDVRVKSVLMYTPAKFTEWLMQKGLLRVDHRCAVHGSNIPFKLGMYSDGANKQPFSGGYVWISDCCKDKQISVFQGSIFEASVYPPGTLMKLIYHWSCQTLAANVLQWVKVTSYYLKNFYTLLRSACVAGLHENCPMMGGAGKYIEIGIITLGTTVSSTAGQQKQVKIEILGVFDPSSKCLRMKVINPQNVGVSNANNERISQILWPLNHWVDKKSMILIDTSMDKSLLEEMGFKSVSQSKGGVQNQAQKSSTPTNVNVMNYLKNVVPKMFQNTLCVLSKSLIQQFLDELSWREIWGGNPTSAYDTIIIHLVQMTKADIKESLISRLNKISLNPFSEWSLNQKPATGMECLPESIRGSDSVGVSNSYADFPSIDGLGEIAANYMRNRTTNQTVATYGVTNLSNGASAALKRKMEATASVSELTKYLTATSKIFTLQTYYYVSIVSAQETKFLRGDFPQNLKCPLCSKLFISNKDAMKHIIIHVVNVGRTGGTQAICNYCLKEVAPASSLQTHSNESHKLVDIPFCCRICTEKFASETNLILHMWQHHVECEAPFRCEACEFRSSYHHEVVDHFEMEHTGLDCVQCPICLRVLTAKSFACLKILVVHLQNHMIKKGKKCPDCCLVFVNDQDYRAHFVQDRAHDSRAHYEFKRQKLIGEPIGMAKPPIVTRTKLPPVAKKARTTSAEAARKATADNPSVTTLNSELAVPMNPSEKFAYNRFLVSVTGLSKGQFTCWECGRDMCMPFHFTGSMKCTKCKYSTHCPAGMTNHTKVHGPRGVLTNFGPQLPKPVKDGEEDLYCLCGFRSHYPDRLAFHLLMCDQKIARPLKEDESQDNEEPPVLHEEVSRS